MRLDLGIRHPQYPLDALEINLLHPRVIPLRIRVPQGG
jgi:hypothetical protein